MITKWNAFLLAPDDDNSYHQFSIFLIFINKFLICLKLNRKTLHRGVNLNRFKKIYHLMFENFVCKYMHIKLVGAYIYYIYIYIIYIIYIYIFVASCFFQITLVVFALQRSKLACFIALTILFNTLLFRYLPQVP